MTTALRSNRIGTTRVHLGDLCSPDLEQVLPGTADVQAMPYVGMEDIESNTGRVLGSSHQGEVRSNTFAFDTRHVLYGKLRPYLNKVALPDRSGRCSTELIPLLPVYGVDRQYLAWLLRRPETVSAAMQGKTGSRMPRANMSELFSLIVPLFPLPEQQRIAAKLDEQMATLASAQAALAAQREAAIALRSAVLRTALDPAAHPDWPVLPLGHLGTLQSGGTPSKAESIFWDNGHVPFVTGADITSETVSAINARSFLTTAGIQSGKTAVAAQNDVVIVTRTRVGRVGVAAETLGISQDVTLLRCTSRVLPEYVMWYLLANSERLIAASRGATIQGLTREVVSQLPILVPPLAEQRSVVSFLQRTRTDVDGAIASIGVQATTLDALRTSLLDAAFSGQV